MGFWDGMYEQGYGSEAGNTSWNGGYPDAQITDSPYQSAGVLGDWYGGFKDFLAQGDEWAADVKRKQRNRNRKQNQKNKRNQPRGNRGGGMGMIREASLDTGLGDFGQPDLSRVQRIVNSVIGDATREYRHANQDTKRQLGTDLGRFNRGAAEFDTAARGFARNTGDLFDRQRGMNQAAAAAQRAMLDRARESSMQASQTTGVPLEYAISDTDMSGNMQLDDAMANSREQEWQSLLQANRMGNRREAQNLGADARAAARRALAENNRMIAEAKSRRALTGMEVEKSLWDQHIARRLAEAEYGQRGESIKDSKYQRRASERNNQIERGVLKDSEQAKAMEILWGKPTKMKQQVPYTDPVSGETKFITEEVLVPDYRPSTVREAIQALASNGFTGKRWQRLARQVMQERARQTAVPRFANQVYQSIGSMLPEGG